MNGFIEMKRSMAIALLARLGLSDLPYVLTTQCKEDLIVYLANQVIDCPDEGYNTIISISIDDLEKKVHDLDGAIKILKYYAI